jgi:hypothetical protein
MVESPEEEAQIQERIDKIGNAFESQDYSVAVADFTDAISEWSHQGRADAAVQLAEHVAVYRDKLPEELVGRFDVKLGEGYYLGGNADNDLLEKSEEAYQRVADAKIPDLPKDPERVNAEERRRFSEHFHAGDRLADVAFASGRIAEAKQRYAEAYDARGTFKDTAAEKGPMACAKYGEAAMALILDEPDGYEGAIAVALEDVREAVKPEPELETSMQNLQEAAKKLADCDDNEREKVLAKVHEALVQAGGAKGGVKHANFLELVEVALVEVGEDA